MRLEIPTLATSKKIVRDLLAKAKAAPSLGEAARFYRDARTASEG